jgi:hypothetical protein
MDAADILVTTHSADVPSNWFNFIYKSPKQRQANAPGEFPANRVEAQPSRVGVMED